MAKKFSLVFWMASKEIQIINSIKIPSHSRYEEAVAKMKWQDNPTKQCVYLDAKVVKMSDDKEELEKISVDEDSGTILDGSTKAFSRKVHAIQFDSRKQMKAVEKRKHCMRMNQEKELSECQSIFQVPYGDQYRRIGDKITSNRKKSQVLPDVSTQPSNKKKNVKATSLLKKFDDRNNENENKRGAMKTNYKRTLYKNNNIFEEANNNNINTITNKNGTNDDDGNEYNDENFNPNDGHPDVFNNNYAEDNEDTSNTHYEQKDEEVDDEEMEETRKEKYIYENQPPTSKLFFIPNVTAELISSQKLLLASMEFSYNEAQTNAMIQMSKITAEILTYTPGKVEIFPNSGCYMDESLLTAINLSNSSKNNWKGFVTTMLVQMFGENLKFMSVKGTRGNMAINETIFKTIFNVINDKRPCRITISNYTAHINKLCSNRKRRLNSTSESFQLKNKCMPKIKHGNGNLAKNEITTNIQKLSVRPSTAQDDSNYPKSHVTIGKETKSPILPDNLDLNNNVVANSGSTIVEIHRHSDRSETIVSNPLPMCKIPQQMNIVTANECVPYAQHFEDSAAIMASQERPISTIPQQQLQFQSSNQQCQYNLNSSQYEQYKWFLRHENEILQNFYQKPQRVVQNLTSGHDEIQNHDKFGIEKQATNWTVL
ncbi:hypothetical protein PV326_007558 [Microctonus aethiopoides]|nr:hypothetical protein PV326_007558 [Microctonus aethiopoides]